MLTNTVILILEDFFINLQALLVCAGKQRYLQIACGITYKQAS